MICMTDLCARRGDAYLTPKLVTQNNVVIGLKDVV